MPTSSLALLALCTTACIIALGFLNERVPDRLANTIIYIAGAALAVFLIQGILA